MRKALFLVALPLFAATACSSTSSSSPTDAGAVDAPPDAPFHDAGVVNTFVAWTAVYGADALSLGFANYPSPAGTRCTTAKVGASCYVIDCTGDDAGALPIGVASGRLELYSGANVLLSATPTVEGAYPLAISTTAPRWKAGDTIGIRSEGAELARFDATLTAPAIVTATAPAEGATVDRTQDLVAGWTVTASKVLVAGSQMPSATELRTSTRFFCELDGTAGSGTVPAQALASFKAGPAVLSIGGGATTDVLAGWQPIHVYAVNAQTRGVVIK